MPGIWESAAELLQYAASVSGREEPRENGLAAEEAPPLILVVDPSQSNRRALCELLRQQRCQVLTAARASEALEVLRHARVDLIMLELMLGETSAVDLCRRLKANRASYLIPVFVLAGVPDLDRQVAALEAGADDYLARPLNASILRARVAALLRQKAAVDSLEEAESLLFVLAQAIEQRDEATSGHCQRLDEICAALGAARGLSRGQLLALHRGAYLHDIGKVSVPDAILFKPGPLTPQEWDIMRLHPVKGEQICRPVKSLAAVLPIIRSHHERWDGSGYPDGLAGERIPLLARILQIADIYDALTSPRPYKPALPPARAVQMLTEEARRGWRDPELVRLFSEVLGTRLWPTEPAAAPLPIPPRSLADTPVELPAVAVK